MINDPVANGYNELRTKLMDVFSAECILEIDRACKFAGEAHGSQLRKSGEPYIIHPLAVANILLGLGMDRASICAALLHDVVEDTPVTLDELRKLFGNEVAELVDGVTKLGQVPLSTKEEQQAENIRKMLLAMSHDIRVIIIKLADRIHNMRTLGFVPEKRRREIARETLEIYAPIAHRLGIRPVKEELEDLAISFLDPVAYKEIEESLAAQSTSRNEFIEKIKKKIQERIKDIVEDARVDGRIKSVHGIYRKMYMQNKNFDEIYDIYAVRIIVNTVIDCYNCLGVVHDMFRPIPGRFKDYISTPKQNMYQSLHTTVIGKEGIPFEIQIRTWDMHKTAEYGIAAHWKYKLGKTEGKDADAKFNDRLAWIRQMLESQQDSDDVTDIVSTIKSDLVPEEVFVFTPKGDVISLPAGATVIDFAYAIHSAVGNKMIGAKVDGRMVPIDYEVKTGEIIEVMTSSQQGKGPSRDWLKIVKTSEARSKIRMWFKKERRDENIIEGKIEIEREFRRNNIRFDDDETMRSFMLKIAERYHCGTLDDFYALIGYGGVLLSKIMPHIRDEYVKATKTEAPVEIKLKQPKKSGNDGIIIEGIDNCLVKISRCCSPIPGDEIIGFITRGHGVSIHKRDCTNVPASVPLAAEPERWVKARWDKQQLSKDFQATLYIACVDRIGLMADITVLLSGMHVMIHGINTKESKDKNKVSSITITVTVSSIDHLKNVVSRLEKINGVISITRSGY